jgi:ATP-dependent Zn protease
LRLAGDVDLSLIARTSLGLREPDLARLCQLAAQHASNRQDDLVRMADFSDAIDKIFLERRERQ